MYGVYGSHGSERTIKISRRSNFQMFLTSKFLFILKIFLYLVYITTYSTILLLSIFTFIIPIFVLFSLSYAM